MPFLILSVTKARTIDDLSVVYILSVYTCTDEKFMVFSAKPYITIIMFNFWKVDV